MSDFEDLVSGVDAGLSNPCVVSFSAQPNDRTKEIAIYPVKTQMEIPYGGSFDLNVSLDLTQTRGGKPEDYEISYELFGVDYFLMKDVSIGGGVLEKKEATPKDRVLAKYTSAVEVKPDTKKLTPIPVSARRGKLFLVVSVRRIEDEAIKKAKIEGHILRNSEYDSAILDTGSAFREAVAKALMQNGNLVVGENATVTDDESGVMKFRTNIDGEDVYAELYFVVDDTGGVQIKFAYKGKDSEEVTLHEADLLEMMSNAKGKDGKSAYELWIEAGNEGSVDDFLNSLIGPQGPEGPKGDPGETGETGATGADGKSAYQIWLDEGNSGTEEDFLASLKGDKGDTGDNGAQGNPGAQGEPGESAYDIWVAQGGVGDEAAFLASLKGDKGDKGDPGEQGPPGADGTDGSPGVIISITGQTITDPSSVNMGDELVFSTDAAIAIDTVLSSITSQIAIGWTVKNTGSATISVTKLGEEIASVDAGSSVSGKWIRTSAAVYISVFKRALGEEGNSFVTWGGENNTEVTLNIPDDVDIPLSFYYSKITKISGTTGGMTYLTHYFCQNCTNLTTATINSPKAENFHGVFNSCSSLTSITISAQSAKQFYAMCQNCTNLTTATIDSPIATSAFRAFQNCTNLTTATLNTPKNIGLQHIFVGCPNLINLTFNLASISSVDFTNNDTSEAGAGNVTSLKNITILDGGLASCTSFIITNSTNLTDASIQNIIDALPDWSGTSTTALVSFPPNRLTTDQQSALAAKGWTWSEDGGG